MAEEPPATGQTRYSNIAVVDGIRRARELYRHVQPYHLLAKNTPYPDGCGIDGATATTLRRSLEPYVQLASLRCNAQRALITLIDRESQYFIAETTKPIDWASTQSFEKPEERLWPDCEGVSLSGELCEMTVQLAPAADPCPLFEVSDMAQDHRFSRLPYVQGGPQLRFYAGTPLTTRRGINIGSLCVMDTEPRNGLTQQQSNMLGWLAGLVIAYLETNREAIEGRRARLMSNALNNFVDGKSAMKSPTQEGSRSESDPSDGTPRGLKPRNQTGQTFATNGKSDDAVKSDEPSAMPHCGGSRVVEDVSWGSYSLAKDRTATSSDPSSDEELRGLRPDETVSDSHKFTFGRAANILRECFEMDGRDGVLFLAAGTGLTYTTVSGPITNTDGETKEERSSLDGQDCAPTSSTHQIGTNTSFDPLISAFTKDAKTPASVLAFSTKQEPYLRGQFPGGHPSLCDIDQGVLQELLKRYPQGNIWVSENGGLAWSSDDDQRGTVSRRMSRQQRRRSYYRERELSIMAKLFPGVRHVLFVPLWDAEASRWASGCFIWSTSESRVFSTAIDLGFLSAFGKTIMAECSRLDTLRADQKKADFIGSISHELRSPLHGILAGAEFLTETTTTAFQRSLIDTIEACGRTLLDTINHVLDFSKINSLDRNWRNHRQPRKRLAEAQIGPGAQVSSNQVPSGAPPLRCLYAVTDIAAVAEEVLEGVSVGQIYKQATDLTDISAGNRGRGAGNGLETAPYGYGGRQDKDEDFREDVEVLVDIAKEDWVFMAQPGAIRRIIMNLFGNSIKYTTSGMIKVQLRLKSVPGSRPDQDGKIMVLTISDTGKGIAAKFLSSRLFVPFAQENPLSPGTGLGLSIVRSIVTMMGGNIDLGSRVGEGTTVQISLPLTRPSAGSELTKPSRLSNTTGATHDGIIELLCAEAAGCIVAIHTNHGCSEMPSRNDEFARVLAHYVKDWYGLEVCDWAYRDKASILIIEDKELSDIMHCGINARSERNTAVIVMCSNTKRRSEAEANSLGFQMQGVVEYVSKPCGPYKLARALHICLGRMRDLRSGQLPVNDGLETPCHTVGINELERSQRDRGESPNQVQASGKFSGSQGSEHELVAISKPVAGERSNDTGPMTSPLSPPVQNLSRWIDRVSAAAPLAEAEDSGPRILLVDDNKINLQILQTFMRQKKYKFVDSAENGQVAVRAVEAAKKPYDIIFMDMSMPVMNGFEATRAIRSFEADHEQKRSMIVALTGLANGRDQAEGFACGCDIYLTKPVSLKELGKLLKN